MKALSRKYANKKSLIRNLATSLVLYEQIQTTQAKAKEVKPVVERLINIARSNDLVSRRKLLGFFFDENATKKVFEILLPRYKSIKSGFIKSYKLGNRLGDGAPMMMLKLVAGEAPQVKELEGKDVNKDSQKTDTKEVSEKPASKAGQKTRKTSSSK